MSTYLQKIQILVGGNEKFHLFTPRVNFIIILEAIFARADHKSAKRHQLIDCLYAFLGSVGIKAGHKNVGEINP